MAMKTALALNCAINPRSRFARKNYFYPDLPKGYQISQYDEPVASDGWIEIEVDKTRKRIGVTRVHLEEDAGKSLHEGFPDSDRKSYIDLNRSGVPLIEIVSEPDLRTPDEAFEYLTRLKTLLLYLDVSNCNMEEGSLRCDANVSVRVAGATDFGTKTEVKNLNSFRFLQKALAYEIDRQIEILEGGGTIHQETRLWDSREQRTYGMRSKEFAHDYRYFPEPDLLPLVITEEWKAQVRQSLPELPRARARRFMKNIACPSTTPAIDSRLPGPWRSSFEEVVKAGGEPKLAANWVLNEYPFLLQGSQGRVHGRRRLPAADFGRTSAPWWRKKRSPAPWPRMFWREMIFHPQRAGPDRERKRGLAQISDVDQLAAVAREIIAANPKQVEQYRKGKTATLGWFVGQVMKATRGQANPANGARGVEERIGVNRSPWSVVSSDCARKSKLASCASNFEFRISSSNSGNGRRTTDSLGGVTHAQSRRSSAGLFITGRLRGQDFAGRFQGQDSRPFLFPQSRHARLNERGEPVP